MIDSILFSFPGPEFRSISDWQKALGPKNSTKDVKNRLHRLSTGAGVIAVFGYYRTLKNGGYSLIYFDDEASQTNTQRRKRVQDMQLKWGALSCSELNKLQADNRPNIGVFASTHIEDWLKDTPDIKNMVSAFAPRVSKKTYKSALDIKILSVSEHITFVAVHQSIGKELVSGYEKNKNKLENCLLKHGEYFQHFGGVMKTAPLRHLVKSAVAEDTEVRKESTLKVLRSALVDPKAYNPSRRQEAESDAFLWPWQKCLTYKDEGTDKKSFSYKTVETTSLVYDVRKSTLAMEMFKELGDFSNFIETLLQSFKETVLQSGGFFDMETGDGASAHFVDFEVLKPYMTYQSQQFRAFKCAQEILKNQKSIYKDFEPRLLHGIEALGGAFGLHSGSAVWSIHENKLRVSGNSVVNAARLCSEASTNSIFVTNQFYHELKKDPEANPHSDKYNVSGFRKKPFKGKEYAAKLYGYELCMDTQRETESG